MICKVCGRLFRVKKENRYEVVIYPTGFNVFIERPRVYECFDCPKCGCQNTVNIRERENVNGNDN